MSQTLDYSDWLTKQEAADAIGVTTKTVERLVQSGQIQQARSRRQGRGPELAVYHPDDVARVAQNRRGEAVAFVLPAGVTSPVNGNGHHASTALAIAAAPPPAGEDLLRGFMGAILQAVSQTSQTPATYWVEIPEAARILGRSQAAVRRKIADKTLYAEKDGAWKIRRKDLEAL